MSNSFIYIKQWRDTNINKGRVLNDSDGMACDGLQRRVCEATKLVGYFCSKSDVMLKASDMVGGK